MTLPESITVNLRPLVKADGVTIIGLEPESNNVIWNQNGSTSNSVMLMEQEAFLTRSGILCVPDAITDVKLSATVNGAAYETEIVPITSESITLSKVVANNG